MLTVGDLADVGGQDVPLLADLHERIDVLGRDHGAHALLRFAREHLGRGHAGGAHRNLLEVDVHAAVTGCSQLGGGAGQPGAAEVLDADDEAGLVKVETALDEHLLGERVADLNRGQLLTSAGVSTLVVERRRRENRDATDSVETGACAEQDDLVARARSEGQVQILDAHDAGSEGVDQRVTCIGLVEDRLAADVRQAEGVSVSTDTTHDTVDDATGIGGVSSTEPKLIHDGDRTSTHGHDVADDAADTGRRTLVGLDVRRVVVALDLERDCPAVTDVDDAGVLTDTGQHVGAHLVGGGLAEVSEVDLGGLVRAVLAPHHRVHRQFGVRGTAAQDLLDACVFVVLETELLERLSGIGISRCVRDGIDLVSRHWRVVPSLRESRGKPARSGTPRMCPTKERAGGQSIGVGRRLPQTAAPATPPGLRSIARHTRPGLGNPVGFLKVRVGPLSPSKGLACPRMFVSPTSRHSPSR